MIHRHVAPAEQGLALLAHDLGEPLLAATRLGGSARQKHHAAAVWAGLGQRDAEPAAFTLQKDMRHLDQDAGAITGVFLATAGAAMHEVAQHRQRLRDDLVRTTALHARHEADAAGVVLTGRIVETLLCLALFQIHSPFFIRQPSVTGQGGAPISRSCSNSPAGAWPGSGKFVLLPAKISEKPEQKGRKVYRPTPAGSMQTAANPGYSGRYRRPGGGFSRAGNRVETGFLQPPAAGGQKAAPARARRSARSCRGCSRSRSGPAPRPRPAAGVFPGIAAAAGSHPA